MNSHTHEYALVPGEDASHVPLIRLHGSDGSEVDLLPLAQRLTPGGTHLGRVSQDCRHRGSDSVRAIS